MQATGRPLEWLVWCLTSEKMPFEEGNNNSLVLFHFCPHSIGVMLARNNFVRLCMLWYPANTLIGEGHAQKPARQTLLDFVRELRQGCLQPLVR
jgi:hypothetical protein